MTSGIRIRRPRLAGSGGFTMIEVLVAFVVLATLTLAVQRGLAAALSSTAKAEARLGAELVARTLISTPLGSGTLALQSRSGSMDGYDWEIRFEPLTLPIATRNVVDGKPPAWSPVRMVITVSMPSRADLKIETIRLVGG